MLQLLITLLGLVALVLFFAWLARKAFGSRKPWLRWPGTILSGLLAVIFLVVTLVSGLGIARLYLPTNVPLTDFPVDYSPEVVARGEHLAQVVCASCHSPDRLNPLPLAGGDRSLSVDAGLPLGTLIAPNLTPASGIAQWSDPEIARAIRQRVDPQNRPILMPAVALSNLSDEDVAALVAYLRSQPAVENKVPPIQPSLLTAVLTGVGLFDVSVPEIQGQVVAPVRAVTPEYGKYIVDYLDCRTCHGSDLAGGEPPLGNGPNLTNIMNAWSEEQFTSFMRTGVDRVGRKINPNIMPWIEIGRLNDMEMQALYLYLSSLEPIQRVSVK